jgi:hypothetical protein
LTRITTRAAIKSLNGEGLRSILGLSFLIVKGNNDTLTGDKLTVANLTVANLNTKLFITMRRFLTPVRIRY